MNYQPQQFGNQPQQPTNRCNRCGAPLEAGTMFCRNCGAPVIQQPQQPYQPYMPQATQYDAQPSAQPYIPQASQYETQPTQPTGENYAQAQETLNPNIAAFNEALEKNKKKKKGVLIGVLAALAIIAVAAVIVWFSVLSPMFKYDEAIALRDNGYYEEAIVLFEELGDYKNSAEQVKYCEDKIKEAKYDEAMALFEDNKHAEAVAILETLGDYADSKAKIEEIKADYIEYIQLIYALIEANYEVDGLLADGVELIISSASLYGADRETAVSRLYSGISYTYYSYTYGSCSVVSSSLAQSFVNLLDSSDENMALISSGISLLVNPPKGCEDMYASLKTVYSAYENYHNFVSKRTGITYYSYESTNNSKKSSVDSAMSNAVRSYPSIDDKVSN